jgi:peptide/nickel transport system substrate-binding protein
MSKKLFVLFALVLTFTLILAGCQPEAVDPEVIIQTQEVTVVETQVVEVEKVDPALIERQKTIIFDIDSGAVADPELWNPYAAGRRVDQGFFQAMIEPLFILNLESPDGEILNWLGESFSSNADATEWTVKLREGIKWSDGETLDADDFLFTVNLALDYPELNGMPAFTNLDSVEKVDDLTLKFKLTETDYRFVYTNFVVTSTSSFMISPQHIWEGQDPTTFTNYDPAQGWPVYSGAYVLSEVSESEMTYVRDDDWWGVAAGFQPDLPAAEKLIWVAYGSEETRTAAMARNELDSLMGVNLGSFLALKQLTGTAIAWYPELPYAWIDPCSRNFHFNLTKEPWNDPEMRKAVNHAIDRAQIIDIVYEGTSSISNHWLPSYSAFNSYVALAEDSGLYDQYVIDDYNPDKAKEIIEGLGYVMNAETGYYELNGEELTMTIANFDATEMNSASALLVEQFQAVGINATQDIQAIPSFIENLTNAGFDTYYFFVCGPIDLWSKMDSFSTRHLPAEGEASSGFYANTQRWSSENAEAYSEVVAQMLDYAPGDPMLNDLFLEAMEYWLEDMPALPIAQAIKLVPFNEAYWTNWPTTDNPYIQPATWWQSTHVILHEIQPTQ